MPRSIFGSPNFGFLARYDAGLVVVATRAERYFPDDPVTSLMKLRQLGEMLARQIAARAGVFSSMMDSQSEPTALLQAENERLVAERDMSLISTERAREGATAAAARPQAEAEERLAPKSEFRYLGSAGPAGSMLRQASLGS